MWRDPSGLFPEVDTERGADSPLSPVSVPLGVDTPADVAPSASAPSSKCAWLSGCERDATDYLTGFCASHTEQWLTQVREYTDDIGRGTLEP